MLYNIHITFYVGFALFIWIDEGDTNTYIPYYQCCKRNTIFHSSNIGIEDCIPLKYITNMSIYLLYTPASSAIMRPPAGHALIHEHMQHYTLVTVGCVQRHVILHKCFSSSVDFIIFTNRLLLFPDCVVTFPF